jgi:hypothetical protein
LDLSDAHRNFRRKKSPKPQGQVEKGCENLAIRDFAGFSRI